MSITKMTNQIFEYACELYATPHVLPAMLSASHPVQGIDSAVPAFFHVRYHSHDGVQEYSEL